MPPDIDAILTESRRLRLEAQEVREMAARVRQEVAETRRQTFLQRVTSQEERTRRAGTSRRPKLPDNE